MTGYFFNGRLWISPAAMSRVDDTAMANRNLALGQVVAIIGQSAGGQPNTPLRFGRPQEAIDTLVSGELLDAVLAAFDPSSETNGPGEVVAIRVNPAVQSGLTLVDNGATDSIILAATDYGLRTNQIKVKVESGTNQGKKITTQLGSAYYSKDDIGRAAFTVRYSGGQASAQMTVTNTTVTLQAPNGNTVASIDLATYSTVQALVDRINATSGFSATVASGQSAAPALNGLDSVANQDVKSADYTARADLQACVDWFNSAAEGFVNATRHTNGVAPPANISFTYLTGGSDGTTTNTEWTNAFTVLQTEEVYWVVPVSSSATIHAMADSHAAFMSTQGRKERRAICGTAAGTADTAAIAAALALNSDRTSLVHLGYYDYDRVTGALTLFPPYLLAAKLAGMFAGVDPGEPLTAKAVKVRGLERKLRNPTDTDPLIVGGVLAVEDTPRGFRIVKSISTWLNDSKYNRVEVSTGVATDYTVRSVRERLEEEVLGSKGNPIALSRAVSATETVLRELARPAPIGPGILAGDSTTPAYRNITAELNGDVLSVAFECSPVIPVNYIPVSVSVVPYRGTASV